LKTISQIVYGLKNLLFIADIQGVGLNISKLNRKDIMASIFQGQVIPQIDAEIAEKGHFWMET